MNNNEPVRIVVAGAGAAGLSVAESARAIGYGGEIVLVGREQHIPYDRPPLSKQILSGAWQPEKIHLRSREHLESLDIDMRVSARIIGLDEDSHELVLGDGDRVHYDALAVTTGVSPRTLPNTDHLSGLHVLRDLEHALALRKELRPGRKLVIVGAGVLGSEVAAVATGLGVEVTLIDPMDRPMARIVGTEVSQLISELHAEHSVRLLLNSGVRGFTHVDGAVTGVQLTAGPDIEADAVLVAIGSDPATDFLRGTTVRLGGSSPAEGSRGILCSPNGSATPNIYAAGDVAAWWDDAADRYIRVEHRLNATEQGRTVAKAILTPLTPPVPAVPYFWSDHYGLKLQCFGASSAEDEFHVVQGSLAERRFIGVYTKSGVITSAIGIGSHRELRSWSARIGQPALELHAPAAAS